jgi:hypothetical protein
MSTGIISWDTRGAANRISYTFTHCTKYFYAISYAIGDTNPSV